MRALLYIVVSVLLLSESALGVEPASETRAKWISSDLKYFEEFFFELAEDGSSQPRELGRLPEERLGALRKLSLNNQLEDYLEEKDQNSWRMALARLFYFDSLAKLGAFTLLGLWDLRVRRTAHLKPTGSSEAAPSSSSEAMKEGSVESSCKSKVESVSDFQLNRRSSNSPKRPSRLASFARLAAASGAGAWLAFDLYHASQYQGIDLQMQWMQNESPKDDAKKALGDQLSSLQTSSLFEDLQAHLKQRGLTDVYLTRVIAPFEDEDVWSGAARKAFVIIDHEMDKTIPPVTVELAWNQSQGFWTYADSWFGNPEMRIAGPKPF